MFLSSKLFWVFAQPLSIAFLLCVLAAFAAFSAYRKLCGVFAFLAALVLFVTLFTSTGTVALQVLEARFPRAAQEPQSISCMIVLGGVLESEVTTARGGIEFNQAADRFIEALRLALNHPEARILVSGGDGSISGIYEGEAAASERFFTAFGISPDRLMKENSSRTTYENTLNTAQVLQNASLNDCLLITSAFHMPRSVGLFRASKIPVTPWPVDYRTSGLIDLSLDFTQPALNAQLTTTAVREWMSLIAYYLVGRIGEIFPN
jgi:uncharacterized SAM-binding protein YcdF (DUF218 family)